LSAEEIDNIIATTVAGFDLAAEQARRRQWQRIVENAAETQGRFILRQKTARRRSWECADLSAATAADLPGKIGSGSNFCARLKAKDSSSLRLITYKIHFSSEMKQQYCSAVASATLRSSLPFEHQSSRSIAGCRRFLTLIQCLQRPPT